MARGDCWLLATLASITSVDPGTLTYIMKTPACVPGTSSTSMDVVLHDHALEEKTIKVGISIDKVFVCSSCFLSPFANSVN